MRYDATQRILYIKKKLLFLQKVDVNERFI